MKSEYDFILLDLDNSLIDENIYLYSAFDKITRESKDYKHRLNWIWSRYLTIGRHKILSSYCDFFNLKNQLENYINILRNVKVDLYTFNNVEKFITQLKGKLFIVTNGNPLQQKNKIQNLKSKINYNVIFASEYGKPKPFSDCVQKILKPEHKVLVIGDSIIDYQFSKKLKADFTQVTFSRNINGFAICDTVALNFKG